jgi:putative NADH-flavin reductase
MKIIILGATGGTGKELLRQGLEQGHEITAYVRTPATLTIQDKNLRVIQGELSDPSALQSALTGQDAVISVVGNKRYSGIQSSAISEGLVNIIDAMKAGYVQRIIFVTTFAVSKNIFFPEKLFIKIFLKNNFTDIPRQEELLEKSGLQWTIVRPARLIDGPKTGRYREGKDLPIDPLSKISRADVADFLLRSAQDPGTIGKIITIKNR